MWNEITSQKDLKNFMDLFGGFHDSCIKEFKYVSGAYVSKNSSMHPINNKNILKIIFQRQYNNPISIEMEFIGLLQLKVFPVDDNYTCEILDATMIFNDDCIYWYDSDGLTEIDKNDYKGTLICSSKVRWRIADEYIGKEEAYIG